jgi:hypothetical protein
MGDDMIKLLDSMQLQRVGVVGWATAASSAST